MSAIAIFGNKQFSVSKILFKKKIGSRLTSKITFSKTLDARIKASFAGFNGLRLILLIFFTFFLETLTPEPYKKA